MRSLFSEKLAKVITDYRRLLRRYLETAERYQVLEDLGLKEDGIYQDDMRLYCIGQAILNHIETHFQYSTEGYYSYSGFEYFYESLKAYLDDYVLEDGNVVHRARKAANALMELIQLLGGPSERYFSESVVQKLEQCVRVVMECGSSEQQQVFRDAMKKQLVKNEAIFLPLWKHIQIALLSR